MASNNDVRALIEARKASRGRAGVPQIDPAEVALAEVRTTQPLPVDESAELPTLSEPEPRTKLKSKPARQRITTPAQPPMVPSVMSDPRLSPVDKAQPLVTLNSYAYPDRRRQLKQEAISTGRDMWEIVDDALETYFETRYGKPADAGGD